MDLEDPPTSDARRRVIGKGSIVTVPLLGLLGLGMLTAGLALGLCTIPAFVETPEARTASTPPAFVADRLFFGRAIPGGGAVSDEAWAAFLREVVTPRFPEGLTVWRAEGQWTDAGGQLVRESVFVVEILHPAGVRADPSLATIAAEYKRRFRQGAVLRVATPALGILYE